MPDKPSIDLDMQRAIYQLPSLDNDWHFDCPKCDFCRDYGTKRGAINGAAKHLMTEHRVRLEVR